jgi:hypothetical protein
MDKREAVRVPVRVRAKCRSSGIVVDGLVEDLSRSGLYLRAPVAIARGSSAEIALDLGEDAPLYLNVEVVRVEGDGMGFRFLDDDSKKPLANFIMRQHAASR